MLLTLAAPTRPPAPPKHAVTFTKAELNAVLSLYSLQVSQGSWRDYALDFTRDMACFSAFRHAKDTPLVTVLKIPANTTTGFVFEIYLERKRLSRTPFLEKALDELKSNILN
jgi:hypothetical protein